MRPTRGACNATVVLCTAAACAAGCGGGGGTGGTCDDMIIAGDLVITEVFADADAPTGSSGADEGREWFELYNATGRTIDLTGLEVVHSRGDGTMAHDVRIDTISVAAGDYLVFGNVLPDLVTGHIDYGYADALGDLYNTGIGRIAVRCGGADIDVVTYTEVAPGESRQLDGGAPPDYLTNDDLARWCAATATASEFAPSNFGTPGAANQDCENIVPGMCTDGSGLRATVPPAPGDLVITELMPNPDLVDDALGEWFEVRAGRDVDLNDLTLDRVGDSSAGDVIEAEACLRVGVGDLVVFARSADPVMNGGLPAVTGTFSFSLVGGTASAPGDVAVMMGSTVIDAVTWTGSSTGASLQVDPDFANATDNDNELNFCDGSTAYGAGELGTPGVANVECVFVPPPGFCDDGGSLRAIVKPVAGEIEVSEVVPRPVQVGAAGEWAEIHALVAFDLNELQLGDHNTALAIAVTSTACLPVAAGDRVVFAQVVDPVLNGGVLNVVAAFPSGVDAVDANGRIDVGYNDTVLASLGWTASVLGTSIQIDSIGTQCDAPAGTPSYNGGDDVGTPGAVHSVECPVVIPPGSCFDEGTMAVRPVVEPTAGQIEVTEVLPQPMQAGTAGEFAEIHALVPFDLNGLQLGDHNTALVVAVGTTTCVRLLAGDYAVFAQVVDPALNGGVTNVVAAFPAGVDAVNANGQIDVGVNGVVLDSLPWVTSVLGTSIQIDSVGTQCDAPAGTPSYNGGIDFGTPGAAHTVECPIVVPPGSCFDATAMAVRLIDKPTTGELAITEWMVDPTMVGDTAGEWLEVRASAEFDLNGLQLGDEATALSTAVTDATCLPVVDGDYILFAQTTDPIANGGVFGVVAAFPPAVDFGNSLTRSVIVGIDDLALDTRSWAYGAGANPVAGSSIQIDTDGTQCNAPAATALYNGTDRGTPGAVHTLECP